MKKIYALIASAILLFVCANQGDAQNLKATTTPTVKVDNTALGDTATYTFTYITGYDIAGSTGTPNIFMIYCPTGYNTFKNLWDYSSSTNTTGCGTDIIIKVNGNVQDCDDFRMASSFDYGIQISAYNTLSISKGSKIEIIVSNIIQNPEKSGTYTFEWKTAEGTGAATENFSADITFSGTSGIDDATTKNKLTISPNPASDYIQISGLTADTSYEIFSLVGKRMLSGNTSNNENINVASLTNGMYLIKLANGTSLKFLKK